ncbi:2-oxoglutarate dehydrogenase complex dihydrolipoyllysine-residue succinyltransferase [Pseudogracilibacillus auburnensis]|uniref:Dihydrolipoyllysine-residue succinyltransferase component of 2-oxoglutarate dehydrogenase complex n=1 Tax=Pseudogracilibacillus auburnensis TaxID=1494959 RepID=A0A2V3W1K0_9BACI|nr:2-oxoglutarate dehydrogenase complex dihydrolipoyllysine-residue succinyltransferase [Pseudogracilibacillus auburnensis]PXW86981.1 2-oxoglutarate dehydrogenase E2 component [Pseudogracilibacillus auburnensis]
MKEIKIPELAESITEGTIAEWLVKAGDKVQKGDPVVELETDKVNVEVNSDYAGVIVEVLAEEGDDVSVGDTIAKVDENAEAGTVSEPAADAPKAEATTEEEAPAAVANTETSEDSSDVIASPAARKLARELNIDLSKVKAQDPLGRIRPEDVEAANQPTQSAPAPASKQAAAEPAQEFSKPVKVEKMSRRRQTIAKRLVEAQQTAAMLTTFNEVDMTAVMNMRKERQESFVAKNDIKLGFMSFFTKASVAALKEFPLLNAEIDGTNLIVKEYYDIGIAVSAPGGLVVPVVRDADKLDFAGIEREIVRLGTKARDNQLGIDDLQGGSFTITNGGIFGSMLSTPILNAPQVGILGMHNIVKRAVVMPDDTIEVRPMMYLALSYDHRIVDGKEAVQFLVRIKEMLEDPYDLLLQG